MKYNSKQNFNKLDFVGNFYDNKGSNGEQDLPYMSINNDTNMYLEKCIDSCRSLGYKFAGAQLR